MEALVKKQQKEEIEHQKKLKREIDAIKVSTQHITHVTAYLYLDSVPEVEVEYDLFISNASEDKEDFVRPLAECVIGGFKRQVQLCQHQYFFCVRKILCHYQMAHYKYGSFVNDLMHK